MPKVFICYRREDAPGHAYRLYDHLQREFGAENVFIDINSLRPGDDFEDAIRSILQDCDVVLAIIGRQWLTATDETGRHRLDDPNDFVRLEIQTALASKVRTIPVLVNRATMPPAQDVVETIRPLMRRQAIELSDNRWPYDTNALVGQLRTATSSSPASDKTTADMEVRSNTKFTGRQFAILSGVVALLVVIFLVLKPGEPEPIAPERGAAHAPITGQQGDPAPQSPPPAAGIPATDATSSTKGPLTLCIAEGRAQSCEELCNAGTMAGCTQLGHMSLNALSGVPKDETRARKLYQQACERDETACGYLAWMFERGAGEVSKDLARAVSLYRRGCTANNGYACVNLGSLYDSGRDGVGEDDKMALTFYEKGCDLNELNGCAFSATLYVEDRAVPKNEARALALYQKACNYNNPAGCDGLGWMNERGLGGLAKDTSRATALYQKACDAGSIHACENLKVLLSR